MDRSRFALLTLLAAVLVFEIYRAATQSITLGEARLYTEFIRPNPTVILQKYDAGHHILQTYLSWYLSKRFGWSEIVLRLPSLLALVGYLAFVWRFCRRRLPGNWVCFAAAAVLCSNPLVLDFFAMARGYGLAIALFAWSLLTGVEAVEERRRLTVSGILAALSVAANFAFLVPVCALGASIVWIEMRRERRRFEELLAEYLGPAFVCCALLVMLPLLGMRPIHLYAGATTAADALYSTMHFTFGVEWVGYLVLAAGALRIARVAWRGRRAQPALLALTAAPLALAVAATVAARWGAGVPYPSARTALGLEFLFEIAVLAAIAAWLNAGGARWKGAAAAALLALGMFRLAQNDPRRFSEWQFDSRTKHVMQLIRARQAGNAEPFTVSSDNDYAWTLNYYRLRYKMEKLEEMKPGGPFPGADYYLLHRAAAGAVRQMKLQVLYDDDLCACLLAARTPASAR